MAKSSLNSKGFLQRIAEALERWAKIEIKPCPPLSQEGYFERIAIALEKMFGDGSSDSLVDSAIVDKSVVGEEERPPMQTIWEGTFDATYSEDVGGNYYTTQDIQNGELIKNCNEVTVTFDGTTYTLPVEQTPFGYGVGDDVEPSSDHPFILAFMVESPSSAVLKTLAIFTLTEGEHTIKVDENDARRSR